MFKFLDTHTYNMPCHFGGLEGSGISVFYNDNTDINVSYETEMDALEKYVHEDYEIILPIINVSFVFCHEVDFLAGGCYNIARPWCQCVTKRRKKRSMAFTHSLFGKIRQIRFSAAGNKAVYRKSSAIFRNIRWSVIIFSLLPVTMALIF